ncbi:hypothetical protein GCM10023153_30240 [Ornithinibacter aureus]|uniref:Uncharacterized protein n=1 Tax=Ornithinibacter aureus TaxID=622664 RepID=A0ABP8K750_9MICO
MPGGPGRETEEPVLLPELRRIHAENYSVYGVRKIHTIWGVGGGLTPFGRSGPVTTYPTHVPDALPDLTCSGV